MIRIASIVALATICGAGCAGQKNFRRAAGPGKANNNGFPRCGLPELPDLPIDASDASRVDVHQTDEVRIVGRLMRSRGSEFDLVAPCGPIGDFGSIRFRPGVCAPEESIVLVEARVRPITPDPMVMTADGPYYDVVDYKIIGLVDKDAFCSGDH